MARALLERRLGCGKRPADASRAETCVRLAIHDVGSSGCTAIVWRRGIDYATDMTR